MYSIHFIDFSIVVIYLLACLIIGFKKENKVKNLKEYAIGSGNISTFALIAMIFSTHIGAGATVGEVERIFTLGMFYAAAYIFNPFFWIITAKIYTNNIENFRGCISLTDIMYKLYGPTGRWLTVFFSIILSVGLVATQFSAIGFLLEHFFAVQFQFGVIFGGLIICMYVAFGGAKAIITTDVFQFIIFYIAIPLACALAFAHVNGIEGLVHSLPEKMFEIDLSGDRFWLYSSFLLYAILPVSSSTFIQKFLMAKDAEQLRSSFVRIFFLNIPFVFVICLIGFVIKALAPDIEPNHAFYYLISHYFPVGVIGFIICGILAVIMSTANSWINSGATICANDIARLVNPHFSENRKLMIARISTFIISFIAIILALYGGSVMQLVWLSDNFWSPIMIFPIICGFLNFKTNSTTFIFSVICTLCATATTAYTRGGFDTLSFLIGLTTSITTFLLAHYVQIFTKRIKNSNDHKLIMHLKRTIKELLAYFSFKNLHKLIYQGFSVEQNHYITFCIFMIYQYIPATLEGAISGTIHYWPLQFIKISTLLFALMLFTFEYWSLKFFKRFIPPFWYFNIFYSLCFSSIFMVLVNANKIIWVFHLVLCIILLMMFLSTRALVSFLGMGAFLAFSIYFLMNGGVPVGEVLPLNYTYVFLSLAYGVMGMVMIYIVKDAFDIKEQELSDSTHTIAYEAISPLSSTTGNIENFEKILDLAKDAGGNKVEISKEQLAKLRQIASELKRSSTKGLRLVNAVLKSRIK
jgi:SSS family solute:Na+ symporter